MLHLLLELKQTTGECSPYPFAAKSPIELPFPVNLALPFNGIHSFKKLIYGHIFENKFKNI